MADEDAIGVHGAFPLSMGVWKGRADVIEQVLRLGRGPWPQKEDGFGASQAA